MRLIWQKPLTNAYDSCHICATLQKFPNRLIMQSSEDPPEPADTSFAANQQLLLVTRESVTSHTKACFLDNERLKPFVTVTQKLTVELHPFEGPVPL